MDTNLLSEHLTKIYLPVASVGYIKVLSPDTEILGLILYGASRKGGTDGTAQA